MKAGDLKVSDEVFIKDLWNNTENYKNQINKPTKILSIRRARCETGFLLSVKTKSGQLRELSAGWFEGVE